MSFDQKIQEIDQQITERVQRSVKEQIDGLTGRLPTSFLDPETLSAATEEIAAEARTAALGEVFAVAKALDGERTQAGVLTALLRESGRFSSRAIIFLTRADSAAGWGSRGFGDASTEITDLQQGYQDDKAWSTLAAGQAAVSLEAADCAPLCSRLESTVPRRGLLVPLVLRDQVAAALYADELETGPSFSAESLQLLVYLAAQAIETLPLRERETTPTLARSETLSEGADDEPSIGGLPLWGGAGAGAAAPAIDATSVTEEISTGDGSPEPPLETGRVPTYLAEPEEGEPGDEDEPEDETLVGGLPVEDSPEDAFEAEDDSVEVSLVEEPADELEDAGAVALEEVELEDVEVEEIEVEDVEVEEVTFEATTVTPEEPDPLEDEEDSLDEEASAEADSVQETSPFDTSDDLSSDDAAAEVDSSQGASSEAFQAALAAEPETSEIDPAVDIHDDATVLLPPRPGSAFGGAPVGGAPVGHETIQVRPGQTMPTPPAPPSPTAAGTTQIAPPADVEGPGWAFGRGRTLNEDEARHEEARRLARLLVNEIQLYNQEEVEEGRRNNDIYERLRADIDRSRQMYEERVDEPIRSSTDYFYQELVVALAGGDPKALGV